MNIKVTITFLFQAPFGFNGCTYDVHYMKPLKHLSTNINDYLWYLIIYETNSIRDKLLVFLSLQPHISKPGEVLVKMGIYQIIIHQQQILQCIIVSSASIFPVLITVKVWFNRADLTPSGSKLVSKRTF